MFQQIETEPAYRKVATALLERILDRTLRDGDRLPAETELARQFGVNRSTVREALRELQSTGMLTRRRGSKCFAITRPAPGVVAQGVSRALALHDVTVLNVWEALTILEPPIAEAAARRRTPEDLGRLMFAARAFAAGNRDTALAAQRVIEFFRCVGAASHNPVLMLAQDPLLALLQTSLRAMMDRVPQARSRIVTAQTRLCDALAAGRIEDARTWMARHIRDFRRGYELAGIPLESPCDAGNQVP
ncbi:MAG TPA: GntR family transcriptional regulator [Steroidobacteraceae bacterium]|nr:GntR family transcriptional regulator [Steroidobacteraceae bacterium]